MKIEELGTEKNMNYDVIVVGGGPAGLFSAYYLSEQSALIAGNGKQSCLEKLEKLIPEGKCDGFD